jgi:hypothetical protein
MSDSPKITLHKRRAVWTELLLYVKGGGWIPTSSSHLTNLICIHNRVAPCPRCSDEMFKTFPDDCDVLDLILTPGDGEPLHVNADKLLALKFIISKCSLCQEMQRLHKFVGLTAPVLPSEYCPRCRFSCRLCQICGKRSLSPVLYPGLSKTECPNCKPVCLNCGQPEKEGCCFATSVQKAARVEPFSMDEVMSHEYHFNPTNETHRLLARSKRHQDLRPKLPKVPFRLAIGNEMLSPVVVNFIRAFVPPAGAKNLTLVVHPYTLDIPSLGSRSALARVLIPASAVRGGTQAAVQLRHMRDRISAIYRHASFAIGPDVGMISELAHDQHTIIWSMPKHGREALLLSNYVSGTGRADPLQPELGGDWQYVAEVRPVAEGGQPAEGQGQWQDDVLPIFADARLRRLTPLDEAAVLADMIRLGELRGHPRPPQPEEEEEGDGDGNA